MNTIPTTFDEHQITRTIIGGKPNVTPDVLNISVILLNKSGSHFVDENLCVNGSLLMKLFTKEKTISEQYNPCLLNIYCLTSLILLGGKSVSISDSDTRSVFMNRSKLSPCLMLSISVMTSR